MFEKQGVKYVRGGGGGPQGNNVQVQHCTHRQFSNEANELLWRIFTIKLNLKIFLIIKGNFFLHHRWRHNSFLSTDSIDE